MLAAVPSVVIGLWGIYVLAPFNAQHVQPFISSILGWLPIFANGAGQGRVHGLQRDHRADDHDHPDHVVDLPRALHRRARGARRRLDRARRDALGDGQDRRRPVGARRRRGGDHARARTRARRGDRGHSGDRQLHPAAALDLRAGRHDREPPGEPVPGRDHEHPDLGADLPRPDPARDHVRHELRGAAHRQAVRGPAERAADDGAGVSASRRPAALAAGCS